MKKNFSFINVINLAFAAFFLCTSAFAKLDVVVSFSILHDITMQIGKDLINVHSIVGPNSDAHVFSPTPATGKMVAKADLVIINGLGFEGWFNRLAKEGKYIVIASKGVRPLKMDKGLDPHAWHSIKNIIIYTRNIENALATLDPQHADIYHENANAYIEKLQELDDWVNDQIKTIPANKRVVITAHDAFNYFGQEYKVKFMAPVGVSTEAQASARDVARIIDQIKKNKIKAVFVENIANPRQIIQIAEDIGMRISDQVLYSDALSLPSQPGYSYIAMMRHNVSALTSAMR